jgi:hypothetical protein
VENWAGLNCTSLDSLTYMYKSNLKIHQITLQQTTWSQSSISESFTCLLIIETFQHQKGTNFVHSILLTTHQVNCLWNERVSFYLFLFSKTCHFLKVTKIQNVFSSSLYLTLFRPGKGGISPYMSVTWPSRLGIGLREINCPQSSYMVNLCYLPFLIFMQQGWNFLSAIVSHQD